MGPKRFYKSQNFSLSIIKFKKLGFSASLRLDGFSLDIQKHWITRVSAKEEPTCQYESQNA